AQLAAGHRHLRFHLLHADRLPRRARHHRHGGAAGDHAALHARSLHARAPLRLRRRGLVLALRRRGLAGLVHLRLCPVAEPEYRRQGAQNAGWGMITPVAMPISSVRNNTTDKVMRTVRAQAVRLERLESRSRNTRAAPRLVRMASSMTMMKSLIHGDIRHSP